MTRYRHLASRPALVAVLALALCGPALAAPAFSKQGAAFGAALSCPSSGASAPASTMLSVARLELSATQQGSLASWISSLMTRVGYPALLPTDPGARAAALSVADLLRNGRIVAAKMGGDEAIATIPAYKKSEFSASFESLVTVLTQPIMHESKRSLTRAEGELDHGHAHDNGAGADLESSSQSLASVIDRIQVAKKAMGSVYELLPVRYYILAQGFRDEAAAKVSSSMVCALQLSAFDRKKLDVSARFVAMPAAPKR